ncbi:MAG: ribosome small subunit-dependent GTPase A [Lachnospiraceae bacterium]|nr:ribosome small subunit-dependent GTPase A [Lachnospiraceae bacterium]
MKGRIVKGVGGFYYVHTDNGIYTCRAKGLFRHDNMKPLVGDVVETDIISEEEMTGNVTDIYDRKNVLIRPSVANVDQALIIFALKDPEPNFVTLDKMILQYVAQSVPVLICFNKDDLSDEASVKRVISDYKNSGCDLIVTSAKENEGIDELKKTLSGKTTTVAGPSGVGKSSIINRLINDDIQKTGEISEKLSRGKHTTRHSEIIPVADNTYIIDTPGFSSFDLFDIKAEDLSEYYEEFGNVSACRFMPCSHTHEPDCSVKEAVERGDISRLRYDDYVYIYNELTKSRRYR